MDATHLHLMLNHLPIVGVPLVALLLALGLRRGSRELVRTAAGAAVLLAALTYPVFLTGEPAEERVRDAAWFDERFVHDHEERAEAALIAVLLTGLAAAAALWQSRGERPAPRNTAAVTLGGLVVSAALLGWAGLAGGQIRHDEIRSGALVSPDTGPGERGGDHDD